ncbi:MAG: hypothetical protein U0T75_08725 [Chitinophagales bacterium]
MKKVVVALFTAGLIAGMGSCTKDKTGPINTNCVQADTLNTYTKTVKDIMDINCAFGGCHDAASAESGIILDTYEHTVDVAKNSAKFYCVMDWSCSPQMPDGMPKLDSADLAKIYAWRDNCYPQ